MFDAYYNILNPTSILDIVEKSVLQSLMQSFFYRQRTGLMLRYDNGTDSMSRKLENLEPFDGHHKSHEAFHPFCAEFRKVDTCESKCHHCDEIHADKLFSGTVKGLQEYTCHIGLMDLNYPIKINGRVRGVLFAGQRVPEWEAGALDKIKKRVGQEAPDRVDKLLPLLNKKPFPLEMLPAIEYEQLKGEFQLFGEMVQTTVDALYKAKRQEAIQKAAIEASEFLGVSQPDEAEDWWGSTNTVLNELEKLLGEDSPLVLLVRRKTQYVTCAASKGVGKVPSVNIPLSAQLLELPRNQWAHFHSSQPEYNNVVPQLTYWRMRTAKGKSVSQQMVLYPYHRPGPENSALSTVLVVLGPIHDHKDMMDDICRVMAFHAQVGVLLERMESQKQHFIREVRFTAHSLKTPLQAAMLELKILRDYARGKRKLCADDARILANKVEQLIFESSLDSQMLQVVGKDLRKDFDALAMLRKLLPRFETIGQNQSVTLKLESGDDSPIWVTGVESQIRVAFSNVLDNAVKYSFSKREVRIRIKRIGRGAAEFEFENYGVGIADNLKKELFSLGGRAALKDSRRDRIGFGLGLVQAKDFVDACNGDIEIESHRITEWESAATITVKITLPMKVAP
ncbi:MAG: ATP-binding protein [Planctomycetota bacterium]